jgi:hypothetical protein
MLFMETSAKDNVNVENAFMTLSAALRDRRLALRPQAPSLALPSSSPPMATVLTREPSSGHILLQPPAYDAGIRETPRLPGSAASPKKAKCCTTQ